MVLMTYHLHVWTVHPSHFCTYCAKTMAHKQLLFRWRQHLMFTQWTWLNIKPWSIPTGLIRLLLHIRPHIHVANTMHDPPLGITKCAHEASPGNSSPNMQHAFKAKPASEPTMHTKVPSGVIILTLELVYLSTTLKPVNQVTFVKQKVFCQVDITNILVYMLTMTVISYILLSRRENGCWSPQRQVCFQTLC